jgi:hypothetical protein
MTQTSEFETLPDVDTNGHLGLGASPPALGPRATPGRMARRVPRLQGARMGELSVAPGRRAEIRRRRASTSRPAPDRDGAQRLR